MAKIALLIGVSEHEAAEFSLLPAAKKDVEALQQVLTHPDMGGFDEVNVLISPTRQVMEEAVESLFLGRSKDDLILVYYSGHGIRDDHGRFFFGTRNTKKNNGRLVVSTAVSAQFVNEIMESSRSKRQVIILDCCFSGAFARGFTAKEDDFIDLQNQLGGEGRVLLASSTSTTLAFEAKDSDLSIYTQYFVDGIKTGKADLNNDGLITADELHEYCRQRFQDASIWMKPEIYAFREGYKIILSKAPKSLNLDPKSKYKKQVERFSVRGEISFIGRKALDSLRTKLGLTHEETIEIENDFLKPYREHQDLLSQYEQIFLEAVQRQNPIPSEAVDELEMLREILGLSRGEVDVVERKTVLKLEEEYRKKFSVSDEVPSAKYLLHISDLHFGNLDDANIWYNQLAEDLRYELVCPKLDSIIVSGDIANKSTPSEYLAAQKFFEALCHEFKLQPKQLIIVPGNHDLNWSLSRKAYWLEWRDGYEEKLVDGHFIDMSEVVAIRSEIEYKKRFSYFKDFYQSIRKEPYPLDYEKQAVLYHLKEQNLLFLGLNSAWQLDHYYRSRASIHSDALSNALSQIRRNDEYRDCFKVAVWHHPLNSQFEDRITDHGFIEQLVKAGFRLAIHGHIHKAEASLYRYDYSTSGRRLDIISAGTFGASTKELVPGYPWQYNLLRLEENKLTVITRRREEPNGTWKPDARWLQGVGQDPLSRYEISL